ncbi:hypothetical protein [Nocardia sp. NPDC047648]|uniref:hypothetical protein n=1 Tax=Nocardia sp. NPDC047648 TaxID=3155625 RepID=UPI0033D99CC3
MARLLALGHAVVVERDAEAQSWAGGRVTVFAGDALSTEGGFVDGATLPVAGGRSVLAVDPESR